VIGDNNRSESSPPPIYAAEWSELRVVRRNVFLTILAGIIAIGAKYVADPGLHVTLPSALLALVWAAFWARAYNRYVQWPCPRCGKPWQLKPFWRGLMGPSHAVPRDSCSHCHLPINS